MAFNLLSQLFGSKEGHQLNVTIDDAGQALLGKLGLPSSTAGVIAAVENALDAGINAAPNLTADEKTVLEGLINGLLANASGTPAAGQLPPVALQQAQLRQAGT